MKERKAVTIYDIAKELNVSPTTVSRALNDHFSIGQKTKKAVRELASELGYHRNTIASNLRKNETKTIGVLISWINRPFISSAISGIEQVVNKAGYNVIISQSSDSYEKEVANAKSLLSSQVDGLIVSLAMETTDYAHFEPFQRKGIPLIFFDRIPGELEADNVIIDNYTAAFKATEHLVSIGCKRIAHFAGSQNRNVYQKRKEGYIKALEKHGLEIDESLIFYSSLSFEEGLKGTKKLMKMKNPPDGIFSSNDTAAVAAIQHLKSQNLRIPEDIAVVGFNNDPIASIIEPALTTVELPAVEMGKLAAKQVLLHKNDHELVASKTVVLKTKFIVRESTVKKK